MQPMVSSSQRAKVVVMVANGKLAASVTQSQMPPIMTAMARAKAAEDFRAAPQLGEDLFLLSFQLGGVAGVRVLAGHRDAPFCLVVQLRLLIR